MLIKPVQRYIKRQVEREIFDVVLVQEGYNPAEVKIRLNWGIPKEPETSMADMLRAAELGFVSAEEFRKNAIKLGWELWEKPQLETAVEGAKQ
jgi:macrodomain Ter protein organizer (MatP/YcbG family)